MMDYKTVILLVEALLEKGYVDASKEILKLAGIQIELQEDKKND